MEYWFALANLPISLQEMVILAVSILLWGLIRKPNSFIAASFCATIFAMAIMAAVPNISSEGVFLFKSFISALLDRTIGDIGMRYMISFLGIALVRRILTRIMPKRLFTKY